MDDIARRIVAEIKDLVLEGGEVVYTEYVRKKDRLGAKARKQVEKVEESVDTKKSVAAAYQGWYSRHCPLSNNWHLIATKNSKSYTERVPKKR